MRSIALVAFGFVIAGAAVLKAEDAKTYKTDDEGFVRNWIVLDPIPVDEAVNNHNEESCKAVLDKEYFPGEKDVTPKDGEKVTADGKELAWHAEQSEDYSLEVSKAASDAGKQAEKALYIGVVYVTADKETPEVTLAIGSDDDSMWRVNGQEVIRVYAGRAVDKDQDKSKPLTLKQGANIISFVLINGDGPGAIAARFLDKDGNPIKGLTVSLTPPAK